VGAERAGWVGGWGILLMGMGGVGGSCCGGVRVGCRQASVTVGV
jgi:hypothetical protein